MLFTIRRRSNQNGEYEYQVWPDDLPASAPVPPWLTFNECSPVIQNAILLSGEIVDDFEPEGEVDEAKSSSQAQAGLDDRMQDGDLVLPDDLVDDKR